MPGLKVGFLHPGGMGISLAASAQNSGHTAYWVSAGRSPQTRDRAQEFNLPDAGSLKSLCEICSVIVSICPPHAAEQVANEVAERSFDGVYLDANDISPARALRIADRIERTGAVFVDCGIIGGPAWETGKTRLFLSGEQTARVAACLWALRLHLR